MANFVGMVNDRHPVMCVVGTAPRAQQKETTPEELFEEAERLLKELFPMGKGDERDRAARVQDGILHKLVIAAEEGNLPFRRVETLLKRFEVQRRLFKGVREHFVRACPNSSLGKEEPIGEFRGVLHGWGGRKGPPPGYIAKKAVKRAADRELRSRMKGCS